jgi:NitT/TauT family transport system substrate-binding protein
LKKVAWTVAVALILVVSGLSVYYYAAPRTQSVRLGYLLGDLHQLAVFVALENGYFEHEGVTVSLVGPFTAGPALMKAFAADELDVGYVGTAPALTHAAKGVDIQILASVNNEGSALIVRRDITKIEDLRGKTVAIPMVGSIQDILLRMALLRHGLTYKDLNVIEVRCPDMPAQLEVGRLDGFIAWEPYCAQAIVTGAGKMLASSRDILPGHPCCVLVASRSFITKQPSVMEKIVRVHVKATRFIQERPREAMEIAAKFTKLNLVVIEDAWRRILFDYKTKVEETKLFVEKLIELDIIKKSDISDVDAFIDDLFNLGFLDKIIGPSAYGREG